MYNAIEFVLKEAPGKVILTGVDIPGLDFQIITEAFERLSQNDIVIGPANDGGYYLIGMKTPVKFLFENMQWSNENVLKNTIDRLKKEKMSFYLLEKLCDIANADDLKNLEHEL